jgi:putative ABC transport system ATP-binding protein
MRQGPPGGAARPVSCEALTRIFSDRGGDVRAVNDITLALEPGAFAVIAGPSGSGKTTLLSLIGGLDRPTGGRVCIEDHDLSAISSEALAELRLHRIGFVFQAHNLISVLTAAENVELPLELQGVPFAGRRRRVAAVLDTLEIGHLLHRRPAELSGGQQQRVAVARAVVTRPAIVLADEPTAHLDSESADRLLDLMRELNEQERVTFLIASHDPRVLSRARQVVHLRDGRIVGEERQTAR